MLDFASLYEAHADAVYRFALYVSADPVTAEDVVSETFVRVWGARDRLDLSTVRAYLLTIARNVHLQEQRRARRLEHLDESSLTSRLDSNAGLGDASMSLEAARATAREELEVTLRSLQELPEVDRAAVLLRAQELSYADIGAALGLAPVAARVRVHRARQKLVSLNARPPGAVRETPRSA